MAWQGGWYPSRHTAADLGSRVPKDEFNWGCGRRWFGPSLEGCDGTAAYVVAHSASLPFERDAPFKRRNGNGGAPIAIIQTCGVNAANALNLCSRFDSRVGSAS